MRTLLSCGALEYLVTVTIAELVANIKTHPTANPDIQQGQQQWVEPMYHTE